MNHLHPQEKYDQVYFLTDKPPESIERPDAYEGNINEWSEEIITRTKDLIPALNRPPLIAIAGESCGGKTEGVKKIKQICEKQNLKLFQFSTDNFYHGITHMIMTPILSKYPQFAPDQHQSIIRDIRQITMKSPFHEKLSPENLQQISAYLNQFKLSTAVNQSILSELQTNFANLDFDRPEAINLDRIKQVLQAIHHNQPFTLPTYSMAFSEPTDEALHDPADYDTIAGEGTFVLHQEIAPYFDIKSYIQTPNKAHLFLRRMYRDVIGPEARSTFTPETALMISLRIVMPAAITHIQPTREKADFICHNPYTLPEAVNTSYHEVQDKIKVSRQDLPIIWKKLIDQGFNHIKTSAQSDYYLVDKNLDTLDQEDYQKYIIRARLENDRLELVYKGPRFLNQQNKIIRPAETLVSPENFGTHYQTIDQLLQDFDTAGFKILGQINKKRLLCRKDKMVIALDQVEKLGYFIEFIAHEENQIPAINQLKNDLNLAQHPSYGPYIDQIQIDSGK